MSHRNAEFVSHQQVREIRRRAKQVDSMDFFNLMTGPELLETLEALLQAGGGRGQCEYRGVLSSATTTAD